MTIETCTNAVKFNLIYEIMTLYQSNPLVRATVGQVSGHFGHLFRCIRDGLGARNQLLFAPRVLAHQLGQLGHEQGHPLCNGHDVIVSARPLTHFLVQIVRGKLKMDPNSVFIILSTVQYG